MVRPGIIKSLTVIFSIAIAVGIFINPLTYGSGDIFKINMLSRGMNEIIKALGFSLNIKPDAMINIIVFVEYAIFGISLMITTKLLYENTLKNIFFPLFMGLFSSVAMGYYGSKNKGMISGINSVAVMFYGLILGILVYLLIKFILSGGKVDNLCKNRNSKRGNK